MPEDCLCGYVDIACTRLSVRVYTDRCPVHGPQDDLDLEKQQAEPADDDAVERWAWI